MTERRLAGKVAVVTGGTRGIGRATVVKLAAAGAAVVVSSRSAEDCAALARVLSVDGSTVVPIAADINDEESVRLLYQQVVDRMGRVDMCVNNAGFVPPGDAGVLDTDVETWRRSIDTNLTGTFLCVKHQLPALISGGGGSIVNVSGTAALLGSASPQIGYDAAKAGIIALTRDVAVSHAADGVRCNVVCPGPIAGPMIDSIVPFEVRSDRLRRIPAGRFGTFDEVAEAITFLASPGASWTTGVVLPIDGGITSAYNTREVPIERT